MKVWERASLNTKDDLKALLMDCFGVEMSDEVCCGNPNHIAPLDFVWDMVTDQVLTALLWANRSGGKSFSGGLISWIRSMRSKKHATKILGGSTDQSKKSYEAMDELWRITQAEALLLKKPPLMKRTDWLNGSSVEILSASPNSVRGAHPQKLVLDEIEEMEFYIFEAALSQPQTNHGIKAGTCMMSTMHKSYGIMNYLLQRHKDMGIKLYNWCIFEVLEPCESKATCKISEICPNTNCTKRKGYYKIDDLVQKMKQLSSKSFATEWLCQKPTREGLVYDEFETDEDIENNITSQGYVEGVEIELGIDFGGTNPYAVTVWQEIDGLEVQVDEIYMKNSRNSYVINEAKKRKWWKDVYRGYADSSRPDSIAEWNDAIKKENGGFCIGATCDVNDSIELVQAMIKPVKGKRRLRVNHLRCRMTLMEYDNYHWVERKDEMKPVKDSPSKVFDHAMDSTRYRLWEKHKRSHHYSKPKEKVDRRRKPTVTAKNFDRF